MTKRNITPHQNDVNEVYNLLNRNWVEGKPGMTRYDIEEELGKTFGNGKWYPIMKKVKEMVFENGLTVPNACFENDYTYFITDDPNPVIPGMVSDMRKMNSLNSKTIRDRAFIKAREDRLDHARNGVVYEAAGVMADLAKLIEHTMQIGNQNLRDAMDNRLEMSKAEEQ